MYLIPSRSKLLTEADAVRTNGEATTPRPSLQSE
jgi:hypothetical protein